MLSNKIFLFLFIRKMKDGVTILDQGPNGLRIFWADQDRVFRPNSKLLVMGWKANTKRSACLRTNLVAFTSESEIGKLLRSMSGVFQIN